jgi:hypothetical protein
MVKAVGRYDSSLQMFVQEAHEPDMARLTFLRWLVESGRTDSKIAGPSSGELVNPLTFDVAPDEVEREAIKKSGPPPQYSSYGNYPEVPVHPPLDEWWFG